MSWRLSRSLVRFRAQVDAMAPRRSKKSDGTIGDPAHAARRSGHNPDEHGVVCAYDLTHDPAGGMDAHALADLVLARQDPRLKYVISNRRIGSGPGGISPGKWRRYQGANPHDKHAHFEVVSGPAGDRDGAWHLSPPDRASRTRTPVEDVVTPEDIEKVAQRVAALLGQAPDRMPLAGRIDRSYKLEKAMAERLEVDWKAVENS